MGVDLTVTGQRELNEVAARLRREAARFQRRVSSATKDAVQRSYRPVLVGMLPTFVPDRYAAVLSRGLRVATTVSFASGFVTARVSAPTGGPTGRAVDALERGSLRHPLFGNRGWWYRQRVRRGFASIPLKAIKPHIVREIDHELDKIARDVERA
jgi:hypothetical protein